jgi:cytochrome c
MLLSHDGQTVVVADSDRDLVSFVDIASATVRALLNLSPHDEPGRLVEDNDGNVHVALRGSGDLATVSLATGALVQRRSVCAQPRGVAYDSVNDQVVVACATGELVTLPAASGAAVQSVVVEPDLRDVVIDGDSIFVSKFRTAEILSLTRAGAITQRVFLPGANGASTVAMAWRIRLTSDHQIMAAYQIDSVSSVPTTPGGYGGTNSTPPIVQTAVATVSTTDMTTSFVEAPGGIVLPVDIAAPPAGVTSGGPAVLVAAANWKSPVTPAYGSFQSSSGGSGVPMPVGPGNGAPAPVEGQIIATEIGSGGTIFLQSREPARLYVVTPGGGQVPDAIRATVPLSAVSREDTGHTIFHTNSGGSLACASCHGEGGDDAQTWNFNGTKPRRTPSLLGTVKGTEPYHWDADFADLPALLHDVYTGRMSGPELASDQLAALKGWLEQLPGPKRSAVDPAGAARGAALFAGKAACSTCHSGPSFTNNATVDVGTGGPLQVPPLVGVGARSPFMHTGCAVTLTDRFTKCATTAHGSTGNLTTSEISDLVTYLESL